MQKAIFIFPWKFLSHNAEKFQRGTLLFLRKFLLSKNVRDKRKRKREGEGGYQDFPSKTFCLTVPKNFAGEPFCVSQKLWYRKNLWIRGGESITILSRKFFVSVPKNFVGEPLSVSLISGIEKY